MTDDEDDVDPLDEIAVLTSNLETMLRILRDEPIDLETRRALRAEVEATAAQIREAKASHTHH